MRTILRVYGRIGYFFMLLALSLTAKAQVVERRLNWQQQPKTISTIDGKSIQQPAFTNAAYDEQRGFLPTFTERIPVQGGGKVTAQITNATYSAATGIDNASLQFISENIAVKTELSIYKKQPGAYVQVLPFRKNAAGQVEKLETFTLKITVAGNGLRAASSYAANSVLASGNWYKVAVTAEGMYKIDYDFVKNTLKLDPGSIALNTLAIYGNGGGMVPELNADYYPDDLAENPTLLVDNNGNNRMDEDDYLLFYGQMADKWVFNTSVQEFRHQKNLYTDKNFYFLTTDRGTGKRVQLTGIDGAANNTVTEFDDHAYHESDEENMLESGRNWLGDKMTGSFGNTKSFTYDFPNLITAHPVKLISVIGAKTSYGSNTTVSANGNVLITHFDTGISPNSLYPAGAVAYNGSNTFTATGSQVKIDYKFNISVDPSGTGATYIDWFELHLRRALTQAGDFMAFRNIASAATGNISEFRLQNASADTRVWNVSDISNIQQMNASLSGGQLSFITATGTIKEFISFNTGGAFANPELVEKIQNQNLHASGEPDMIIVTYDGFEAPSNELANFHRQYDGITVNVVKLTQVYNEFGGGKPDISAIRNFMRMLYDRAGNDTAIMPRYLLLMGDGSFDPKGRVANNNNYIPTYQSYESFNQLSTYVADDFYALLDANEGGDITTTQLMDISVGRLPVATEQEAWDIVNKIKNYKRPQATTTCMQINTSTSWRNMITFIADDLDNGGPVFETYSNTLADNARTRYPVYNYDKIFLDAYKQTPTPAGDRYPDVNTAILNRLNSGTLIVNWVGHGGETNWAHERIFNMADIAQLENQNLPLFITATCDFSRYDLPERTAGEMLITNPKGGGIASVTTVRLVYQSGNEALNTAVFNYILEPYEGRYPTLGEITMRTKNDAVLSDVTNTRKFTLLGDPALQLNYPKHDVVTTQVNNQPISQPHDTLKALAEVTIKGEIHDNSGNKLSSFNGVVYPVVYDKISSQRTLSNDIPNSYLNFSLYNNILFKGKASVTNGDFSFTFMVPKDINYQYGTGRISYYAEGGNFVDAHGYSNNIVIGGAADSFLVDKAGPKINLYMNDSSFVFGGITNTSPILLAKMQDESGINTAGNGIGHNITAVIDEDDQNKVVLNDYYQTVLDNYKAGTVTYPFTKLAEGKHTLRVKAWDIQDNSSESYTEFIVTDNAKLALSHVFNYPNPFTTRTKFMFEHNRPCDDLYIGVQIFSVTGKLVKSIQTETHCDGFRVSNIEWDGRDDYGDAIGKGVYVYKVSVRDSQGHTAHKFEKLVVLR